MDNFQELFELYSQTNNQITLFQVLINFFLCMLLSFIVRAFYVKRSFSLIGKTHIASIIPILAGVVFLVIMVVKSSLALSLGLVGALSIVRFRTPIKEPEELAYLFICIATGLGLGANQTIPTVVAVFIILLVVYFLKSKNITLNEKNMFLSLEYQIQTESEKKDIVKKINQEIAKEVIRFDLRRLDYRENLIDITYQVNVENIEILEDIIDNLKKIYPKITVTYLDQSSVPSI